VRFPAMLWIVLLLTACTGGGTIAPGTSGLTPIPAANAARAGATVRLIVTDYFTRKPVAAAHLKIDGAVKAGHGGIFSVALAPGVHSLVIAAAGYATYENAVDVPTAAPQRAIALFPIDAAMQAWIVQIDKDRKSNGAGPVVPDNGLTIAAFDHAADMIVRNYFAHFDPNGFSPTTRSLLLGSMMPGWENLAAGYATAEDAEAAFMSEKADLPHHSPSDCAADWSDAGHYCNIVLPQHNRTGVAIVGTDYDEEFGDYYAMYDTSAIPPEPKLGSSATLSIAALDGSIPSYAFVASMGEPQRIPIATLNADPTCSSACPKNDVWWPSGDSSANDPIKLSFKVNQIYWPILSLAETEQSYAAFWAGGNRLPSIYHKVPNTPAITGATRERIAPNPSTMLPHL
jgi:Cysteine-rich secretory protein family